MAYQSGRNAAVSYKQESTYGTLPGVAAGKTLRVNGGGLSLAKEPIQSNENRRDGQRTRGRHGSRSVSGNYTADLSLGSFDDFIQAVFRGTFTAILTLAQAQMATATVTTTANTIVASAGSWITAGLRIGDVIRLTGLPDVANNNRNLRITGLTATVITVAETLIANAAANAAWNVVRPKKLVMGTTPRSFTIEENEIDIGASEIFVGCRVGSMQIQMQPNGQAVLTFNIVGQDMQIVSGGGAPYFTSPTSTVSIGMTAVEAIIRLGSTDVIDVDSLTLNINLNAAGHPVVGSVLTPDVFTNQASVDGSVTCLKSDVSRAQAFLNETQMSLHLLFTENEAEPKDFCSFFVGNITLASETKSDMGADGPRTQQLALLVGADDRGGAYEAGSVVYATSAT